MSTSESPSFGGPAAPRGRAYHHGNLRAELLATAEQVLRDDGVEKVTLRDLARRAGVSHAAPTRHFPDRGALLTALAAAGYERLGAHVNDALAREADDFDAQFHAVCTTFVHFALENPALLDVMFTIGKGQDAPELAAATAPLYRAFGELVDRGLLRGRLRGDADRLRPLIIATLQGIAAFAAAGGAAADRLDTLIEDACALFTV